MGSRYFDWTTSLKRFIRFDAARAEDVNDALDELSAGLETLDGDVDRAIKLPPGTADQTLNLTPGARANKYLGFDASGNVRVSNVDIDSTGVHATNAQNAATAAAASESAAASSASSASASASNAATSASQAATSATNAANSASAAAASQTAAASSESSAAASAATATTQAGIATTKAGEAAASASAAATSASQAATSATNAANSASAAATSAANAEAAWDALDDRYLGAKTADPVVDNDGNALLVGALYWNTVSNTMRVWSGSAWTDPLVSVSTPYTTFSGTGAQTTFALTGPASLGSIEVFISGVRQNPGTDYTFASNTLTFAVAPPTGTNNIFVRWITTQGIGVPSDQTVTQAKLDPTYEATLVKTTATQTLSNKTLTAPESTGAIYDNGSVRSNIVDLASGTNFDLSLGNYFIRTVNGNVTFTVSNTPASRAFAFTVEITHTSGTITWFPGVVWPGGVAPVLTTNRTHLFTFVTDNGGTTWRAVANVNYTS